ncbi:MAG: ATP-binding protein, partial [Muribaculaceae bacterium]|nr:ATP-binding protein [Muribaculaceae bacterium]
IRTQAERINEDIHAKDIRINEARLSTPLAEEISKAEEHLRSLRHEERELKSKENSLASKAEAITNAIETERLKIEAEYAAILSPMLREVEDIKAEIAAENSLLDRAKGSLIEWLESNVPGWTDTIGRVADEKSVLYNTELKPSLSSLFAEGEGSFFGVNLDLSQLPVKVRSPFQIRENIGLLQERLDAALRRLQAKKDEKENEIKKARTRMMAQLNAVNKEKDETTGAIMMLPQRIDRATVGLNDLRTRSKQEKEKALKALTEEKEKLLTERLKAKENLSAVKAKALKGRQALEKKRAEKEKALRKEVTLFMERQREGVAQSRMWLKGELETLEKKQMEAMKKEGVDTEMVQEKQLALLKVKDTLKEIDTNRTIIVEYRKDKREYIDHIEEFKAQKDAIESKLSLLSEKHEAAFNKKQEEETRYAGQLAKLRQRKDELKQDLEEARHFLESPTAPAGMKEATPLATTDGCRVIVRNIHDTMGKITKGFETLKKEVNAFRQPFSSRNTFGFPERFSTDSDYLAYATSVREFVENDKIRDYQAVSNSIYKDVLGLISREYSTLAERESEIQKVVNEVNRDCAKRQFAGVIRKIEISLNRSDSAVIRTLQHIHEFWSKNSMEIGEANLFASLEGGAGSNAEAVEWLRRLSDLIKEHEDLDEITLSDNFSLKIRVDENGNNTGWSDNLKNVGSEGTDILVKAIINILLINVFKKRSGGRKGEDGFRIHCMMDEIGKLAEENIKGIVDFANARGIYIVNSAPKVHSPLSYRYIYLLNKDSAANTYVHPVLSNRKRTEE